MRDDQDHRTMIKTDNETDFLRLIKTDVQLCFKSPEFSSKLIDSHNPSVGLHAINF